jgi:hypothetical protein
MKRLLVSFASGIVFALGLGISGMTRPVKVIGFLDFAGKWDASLAFVMVGAIAVYFIAYRLIRKRSAPLFAEKFSVPGQKDRSESLCWRGHLRSRVGVGWILPGSGNYIACFRGHTSCRLRHSYGCSDLFTQHGSRIEPFQNSSCSNSSPDRNRCVIARMRVRRQALRKQAEVISEEGQRKFPWSLVSW